jgi:hypothetical protein
MFTSEQDKDRWSVIEAAFTTILSELDVAEQERQKAEFQRRLAENQREDQEKYRQAAEVIRDHEEKSAAAWNGCATN